MIINFLYRFFLAVSIVFLLLSVYLNIAKLGSNNTISNNFMAIPEGTTEVYDEKIAKIDNLDDLKSFVDDEIQKNNFEGIEYTYLY